MYRFLKSGYKRSVLNIMIDIETLRYPIGKYSGGDFSVEEIKVSITDISDAPAHLRNAITGLSDDQLDAPYRDEGWTVRQVVHHLLDSQLNSYIRFKWTLTEDEPLIKTYKQDEWANIPDSKTVPVSLSLQMLESLHEIWVILLKSLSEDQLNRKFEHPEMKRSFNLKWLIGLYAWHGKHHAAQITGLRDRMSWW